jgi:5-bromo-4-chloroindolyl phosphate hydrolysis protein
MRDDLFEVAIDALRNASEPRAPANPEEAERLEAQRAARELQREQDRERRRAAQRRRSQRSLVAVGAGLAAGGLAAATGIFTPAAVGIGLVVGGITSFLLHEAGGLRLPALPKPAPQPRAPIAAPTINANGLSESRAQLVKAVLTDTSTELEKLARLAEANRDPETAPLLGRLVATGQKLVTAVAGAPEKLGLAQRVFTYHLPKAVYLAETLTQLEGFGRENKRTVEARHVLARIENLLEKTLLDLTAVDAREMDVEIRLINEALDEDLGKEPEAKR